MVEEVGAVERVELIEGRLSGRDRLELGHQVVAFDQAEHHRSLKVKLEDKVFLDLSEVLKEQF